MNEIESKLKIKSHLVYLMYALSYFTWITAIIGILIAHIEKKTSIKYNIQYLTDHFLWQIRTFYFCLLGSLILIIIAVITIKPLLAPHMNRDPFGLLAKGITILAFSVILFLTSVYRIIKGWLRLVDNRSPYNK